MSAAVVGTALRAYMHADPAVARHTEGAQQHPRHRLVVHLDLRTRHAAEQAGVQRVLV